MSKNVVGPVLASALDTTASRLKLSAEGLMDTLRATVFGDGKGSSASDEELAMVLAVANEHNLNPITKEIYAFTDGRRGVFPIVGVDGWYKIVNSNPEFDGVEFDEIERDGKLIAVKCSIYRKDRSRATTVSEHLSECARDTMPWKKYPRRMLRHKAFVQCARVAFSLSGIYDPDEVERIKESQAESQPRKRQAPKRAKAAPTPAQEAPAAEPKNITPMSEEQVAHLRQAMHAVEISEQKFCAVFDIGAVEEMPAARFDEAMTRLEQYHAARQAAQADMDSRAAAND